MGEMLIWDTDTATYIRGRGDRYPGAIGIEPHWTQEAVDDPEVAALEPDPKSRMGASRFIGWSPGAGRLLTVIALRDEDGDLHLVNAWPATGADVRLYHQEARNGDDD